MRNRGAVLVHRSMPTAVELFATLFCVRLRRRRRQTQKSYEKNDVFQIADFSLRRKQPRTLDPVGRSPGMGEGLNGFYEIKKKYIYIHTNTLVSAGFVVDIRRSSPSPTRLFSV